MAQEFVRNIKNAKIKGDGKEPLNTNIQNDILSDDEDIAIRHKDGYFILTDGIKKITSKNDNLEVNVTDKNTVELDVKDQGGGIQDISSKNDTIKVTKNNDNVELEGKEVVLSSKNDNLTIDKKGTNEFELDVKDQGGGIQDISSKNDTIKVTKNNDNVELEGKEVVLSSKNDNLTIDKKGTNEFELDVKDQGGGGVEGLGIEKIHDLMNILTPRNGINLYYSESDPTKVTIKGYFSFHNYVGKNELVERLTRIDFNLLTKYNESGVFFGEIPDFTAVNFDSKMYVYAESETDQAIEEYINKGYKTATLIIQIHVKGNFYDNTTTDNYIFRQMYPMEIIKEP